MPTATTPIRLTAEDKAKIDRIKAHFGLGNRAAAVRHAIETVFRAIEPAPKKSRKKSGEGA